LATMEDLAVTMQWALLKGMCETLTSKQAERLTETQPCPECGQECDVKRPSEAPSEQPHNDQDAKKKSREMKLRGGTFELAEPSCYCRSCRRSFFPSADRLED